jgi:hypothetical protein
LATRFVSFLGAVEDVERGILTLDPSSFLSRLAGEGGMCGGTGESRSSIRAIGDSRVPSPVMSGVDVPFAFSDEVMGKGGSSSIACGLLSSVEANSMAGSLLGVVVGG